MRNNLICTAADTPYGAAVDGSHLFIADGAANRVREVGLPPASNGRTSQWASVAASPAPAGWGAKGSPAGRA